MASLVGEVALASKCGADAAVDPGCLRDDYGLCWD